MTFPLRNRKKTYRDATTRKGGLIATARKGTDIASPPPTFYYTTTSTSFKEGGRGPTLPLDSYYPSFRLLLIPTSTFNLYSFRNRVATLQLDTHPALHIQQVDRHSSYPGEKKGQESKEPVTPEDTEELKRKKKYLITR